MSSRLGAAEEVSSISGGDAALAGGAQRLDGTGEAARAPTEPGEGVAQADASRCCVSMLIISMLIISMLIISMLIVSPVPVAACAVT